MVVRFNLNEVQSLLDRPNLFVFRPTGEKCYPRFLEALKSIDPGEVLFIEIPANVVVDYSFVDETVGQLAQYCREELRDRYVVVKVADRNQLENVKASFDLRRVLGIIVDMFGEPHLIGLGDREAPQRNELEETFRLLFERKTLTARQLSDMAKIGLSTASMRLKRLFEEQLARRRPDPEDPRQFIYCSILA